VERYHTAIQILVRIAAICLPLGPILFALKLIDDVVIEGGYLRIALLTYRPAVVLLGCLKVSALALPTVAMLSIGMYLLAKLRRDSFLIAFAVGTILISAGIAITTLIIAGPLSDIDLDDPYTRYEAAGVVVVVLVVSAFLSALYWLIAVRRDRRRRLRAESDTLAIRAME
jgi:hypothetical protein